jgi:diguanylate cyclase (GGDEF)-like protein
MRMIVARAVLTAAIVLASFPGVAGELERLLQEAEQARSTNPHAFAAALEKIEKLQTGATKPQKQQFQLLKSYREAMSGRYDAAIKGAIAVYDDASDSGLKFRSALLIANSAAITREFSLGLRYLEAALALQESVQDTDLRHTGFGVAAVLYNQYGQFALGKHYADLLLSQEPSGRNRCYTKELRVEAIYGMSTAANEREIQEAIADCSSQKEVIASNLLRGYLARQWASEDKTQDAIRLLESNLGEVEATEYPRLIGEINGLLAEYRLKTGDLKRAEDHAHRALDKGGKDAYSLPLVTAHKVLYEAALRRNDLTAALTEYRQYAEADKARLDEVKAREFAFQLSRHELQQKNQSIELLQRQNEVLRLQQEISKKSAINNRLFVAMLLMLLGVGAYWAYKVKRVQVMFRRQAQVDSLTGVSNRRHFREQAEAQLARCKTGDREAALVLLDLDNFKRINDRYGHATGDWVLKQVATACQASCRDGDLFGRLGGEEFAILTCGGDLHAAERIAQQCREHLAAIDTSQFDSEIPTITASYGCATTRLCGHDFENLFMHADHAMYRAKAEGRDRVCSHEERPVLVRTQQVTA